MSTKSSPLERAKKAVGGSSGLARRLGIRSQAVSQWKRVPSERVVDVERITGISRQELRPDLYSGASPKYATMNGREERDDRQTSAGLGHFTRFKHLRKDRYKSAEEIEEYIRALRDEWSHR